jgi:hypothetical protein
VTNFKNPPAEGTYRVWVEPRERLWSPITPTAETAFSVAMGMRDAPREVFRGTILGRLIVVQVGQRTHITGQWESVLPDVFELRHACSLVFSRTSSCASSNLDLLGKPLTNIFPAAVKMLTFPLTSRSVRRETLAALAKKRARFVKPASTPPPLRETRQERKQMAAKDFTISTALRDSIPSGNPRVIFCERPVTPEVVT